MAISPFIFGYEDDETGLWVLAFASSSAVVVLAAASFWPPLRRVYLLELFVGASVIGISYVWASCPPSAALQNNVAWGIFLMMFAIIPSHAERPPAEWLEAEP
jgi:hypothetical protein